MPNPGYVKTKRIAGARVPGRQRIWKEMSRGKYFGLSLPEIIAVDPRYVFRSILKNRLPTELAEDAELIMARATRIKPPRRGQCICLFEDEGNEVYHFAVVPSAVMSKYNGVERGAHFVALNLARSYRKKIHRKGSSKSLRAAFVQEYFEKRRVKPTKKSLEAFFEQELNFYTRPMRITSREVVELSSQGVDPFTGKFAPAYYAPLPAAKSRY